LTASSSGRPWYFVSYCFTGGADRDRTDDLLNAMRETRVDFKGKFKDIKGLIATDYH